MYLIIDPTSLRHIYNVHAKYNYCVNFLPNEVSELIIDKPTQNAFALIMLDSHITHYYLTLDFPVKPP